MEEIFVANVEKEVKKANRNYKAGSLKKMYICYVNNKIVKIYTEPSLLFIFLAKLSADDLVNSVIEVYEHRYDEYEYVYKM